jgi:hypothetical protein
MSWQTKVVAIRKRSNRCDTFTKNNVMHNTPNTQPLLLCTAVNHYLLAWDRMSHAMLGHTRALQAV